MNKNKILIGLMGLILVSCGDKEDEESEIEEEQPTETMITLDNCDASISTSAPEFYKNFFSCVEVSSSGSAVTIKTDGNPPYQSWYYPETHSNYIPYEAQGSQYFRNPNRIAEKNYSVTIQNNPTPRNLTINSTLVDGIVNTSNYEYKMGIAGVALNGVAMFNPLAAPGDDIEDEKYSFDLYNAHPTQDGSYHYHTVSPGPLEVLKHKGFIQNTTPGSGEFELYGIMCDGTVILGCTELDGSTPTDNDFVAQNGHVHDIKDQNGVTHFSNRYHTHMCPDVFTNFKFTPEIQYYQDCN